jgi:hypothetical protein
MNFQSIAGKRCKPPIRLPSVLDLVTDQDSELHLLALLQVAREIILARLAPVDVHDLDETIARIAHGLERRGFVGCQLLGEEFEEAPRTKLKELILAVIEMCELELGALRVVRLLELVALSECVGYMTVSARFDRPRGV